MGEESDEFGNERIVALLAGMAVQTIPLHLSPESERAVRAISTEGDWTDEEALQLATVYGIVALAQESAWDSRASADAGVETALIHAVQDRESLYAALKFHVHKLRHAIFVTEARITGTKGQNDTFTSLIRQLRTQLDSGAAPG